MCWNITCSRRVCRGIRAVVGRHGLKCRSGGGVTRGLLRDIIPHGLLGQILERTRRSLWGRGLSGHSRGGDRSGRDFVERRTVAFGQIIVQVIVDVGHLITLRRGPCGRTP